MIWLGSPNRPSFILTTLPQRLNRNKSEKDKNYGEHGHPLTFWPPIWKNLGVRRDFFAEGSKKLKAFYGGRQGRDPKITKNGLKVT